MWQLNHLSEKQIRRWQTTSIKTAGRCKCQLAKVGLTIFQIEIGTHEWEWFGKLFRILEKLIHTFRFRDGKSFRGGLSLTVESLQVPFAIKEIEVGALLYFSNYTGVTYTSGAMPGLKAFVAAVFGGIGSIPGAVIGAFIIGICETLLKGMGLTAFSDAFTFALLIIILVVKPTGLFGESLNEKV